GLPQGVGRAAVRPPPRRTAPVTMQACTLIARNYTAQARVLAESFAAHNPGSTFSTLIIDGPGPHPPEPYEILLPEDLDLDEAEFRRMAATSDVLELAPAPQPWLRRHAHRQSEPER